LIHANHDRCRKSIGNSVAEELISTRSLRQKLQDTFPGFAEPHWIADNACQSSAFVRIRLDRIQINEAEEFGAEFQ